MKKTINTSGNDHDHGHGSKDLDERKKHQINNSSSSSGSETDVQSFITQPFSRQWTPSDGSGGDAIPEVNFSSAEMENLQARHHLSLFVKVFGKRIGFRRMFSHLRRVWNPEGGLDIVPLENEFYLVRFSDVSDYNKALEGVPWMIDYHYITLHRWSPNFKPSEAIITRTAVWIRLQELPVEYYDDGALRRIAAVIGRPVKVDPVTEMRLKCKFARLCVELDLREPLPSYVKLPNGVWQPIQYEGLHVLCSECRRVGHSREDCLFRAPVSTPGSTSPPPEPSVSRDPSLNNSFVYHPWPQVPPGTTPQLRSPQLTYHSGQASGPGRQAWSSRFQVLAGESNESGANQEQDRAITSPSPRATAKKHLESSNFQIGEGSSSTMRNVKTYDQNKPVPKSPTQAQRPEEATKGEIEAPCESPIFPQYFSLNTSSSSSPFHPKPGLHQVASAPTIPSNAGSQCVPLQEIEFHSSVMQKAVVKREINRAPAEIEERSTEGCPSLFGIDSKVSELVMDVNMSPLPSGNGKKHQISINPTNIDHTEYATPSSSNKKILSWNCRGASHPARIRAMKDLCKAHNPSILLLLETRTSRKDADQVIKDLGFSGSYCIDPEGYTGGVWVLWRKEHIQLNVTRGTSDHIHAVVRFSPTEGYDPQGWIVYGLESDQD